MLSINLFRVIGNFCNLNSHRNEFIDNIRHTMSNLSKQLLRNTQVRKKHSRSKLKAILIRRVSSEWASEQKKRVNNPVPESHGALEIPKSGRKNHSHLTKWPNGVSTSIRHFVREKKTARLLGSSHGEYFSHYDVARPATIITKHTKKYSKHEFI